MFPHRKAVASPQIDMTHFLSHQVFDDTDFWDFIRSTYFYTSDFIISQKAVGQFSADTAQHFAKVLHLNNIWIVFKHGHLFHVTAPHTAHLEIKFTEIKVSGSWHKNRDHHLLISHSKGHIPWWSPLLLT